MNEIKAILLLDRFSRTMIKTNIAELSSHGIAYINNLEEITEDMLLQTHNVIILEGFLQSANSIPNLRLFKAIQELEYLFIGMNETYLNEMQDLSNVYKADIALLTYSVIEAALFRDDTYINEKQESIYNLNVENAKAIVSSSDNDYDKKVRDIAQEFLSVRSTIDVLHRQLKESQELNRANSIYTKKLEDQNHRILEDYMEILKSADDLNKSLHDYEVALSHDFYDKVSLASYTQRPSVLYLKSQGHLDYLDELIETLFSVFQLQMKMSVKVVRLYDSVGLAEVKTLPKYYTLYTNKFLNKDITVQDYICKTGSYSDLLDILLTNRTGLDILILVDCKSKPDVILTGDFCQYNFCSKDTDINSLGLQKGNTIVNFTSKEHEEEYLVWNNFSSLDTMSDDDKFLYLSSENVVVNIIKSMKELFETM